MRAAARRLRQRLGRRGAILVLKGTIATLYGLGQLTTPTADRRGLCLLLRHVPLTTWAWLWIAVGATALVCAWLPPRRDWPGFLAVWAITAPWSMAYLVSWWPLHETSSGWVPAVIFGAWGGVCLVVIGWDESAPRGAEPHLEH
jgi:hypothetical protein